MATLARWVQSPQHGEGTPAIPVPPAPPKRHEIPPDLLTLTTLDAREGVGRIGGKPEAYRKQLRRLREHYPNAINELRRLLREEGTQRAEEYCHALKGVTGNIAAHPLYEKMVALDAQLKLGEVPDDAALTEADTLLQLVMREIDSLVDAEATAAPVAAAPISTDALRALLGRMKYALEYDLGAVDALVGELRAGVAGTPQEADAAEIAKLADLFDTEQALQRLRAMEASITSKAS
jgi:two-component system, sensor histidine kinase and response regulator